MYRDKFSNPVTSVYQEYYISHQLHDRSPSDIAWIGSLQAFFLFAANIVGGPLFDRYGAKVRTVFWPSRTISRLANNFHQIIWPAATAMVLSLMMTSLCKEYYQFILAQGVLGGIAIGLTMSPSMAAPAQYFQKKRGATMGLAVAGSSVGGVVFPIALGKMFANEALGFGWSVRIIGFTIMTCLAITCACIKSRLPPRKQNFLLFSAFKEPQFLVVITSAFMGIIGMFTPIFFLPSYAVSHGMDRVLASYLVAILNSASFFGRVLPGILSDKLGRFNVFAFSAISTGILTLCWQKATTNAGIIVFAAIFGFCSGAIVSSMATCLTSIPKDPKNIGTYMGMGMGVASFGALAGPPINGALVDHYASFTQASIFSGIIVLAAGFTVLFGKLTTEKGILART